WRARAREASIMGNALTDSFPYDVAVPLGLDIDLVLQQDPIDWNVRPGRTGWT
ncbi:MAG: histidine kinase, partial [Burkholderiaceae bacterium]